MTFCGSARNSCFVFAFVSTIISELGLGEMQPEKVTANKQVSANFNLRSIANSILFANQRIFQSGKLLGFMLRESKQMKHHDY
jgi:hypothetical protein